MDSMLNVHVSAERNFDQQVLKSRIKYCMTAAIIAFRTGFPTKIWRNQWNKKAQVQWNEIRKSGLVDGAASHDSRLLVFFSTSFEESRSGLCFVFMKLFIFFLKKNWQRRFPSIQRQFHSIVVDVDGAFFHMPSCGIKNNIRIQNITWPNKHQQTTWLRRVEKKLNFLKFISHLIPEIWPFCTAFCLAFIVFESCQFLTFHTHTHNHIRLERTKHAKITITFIVYWVVRELTVEHCVPFVHFSFKLWFATNFKSEQPEQRRQQKMRWSLELQWVLIQMCKRHKDLCVYANKNLTAEVTVVAVDIDCFIFSGDCSY